MQTAIREKLSWQDFEDACSHLASQLSSSGPFDLVVGIARGGMPVAVRLSHKLNCREFGMIMVGRTASEAGFDIQDETVATPFQATASRASRVLIIDDVTSSGTTLGHVADRVRDRFGVGTECKFAVIYADVSAIRSAGNQHILDRMAFHRDIDNSAVWVDFPWEM